MSDNKQFLEALYLNCDSSGGKPPSYCWAPKRRKVASQTRQNVIQNDCISENSPTPEPSSRGKRKL